MANIYIIAGPPGIGKSTLGYRSIPSEVDVLDQDEMRYRYKMQGEPYYNQHSILRFQNMVRRKLITDEDFALELNLGFESHYDYVLSLKRNNPENTLNVILFFTDKRQALSRASGYRRDVSKHVATT